MSSCFEQTSSACSQNALLTLETVLNSLHDDTLTIGLVTSGKKW